MHAHTHHNNCFELSLQFGLALLLITKGLQRKAVGTNQRDEIFFILGQTRERFPSILEVKNKQTAF